MWDIYKEKAIALVAEKEFDLIKNRSEILLGTFSKPIL